MKRISGRNSNGNVLLLEQPTVIGLTIKKTGSLGMNRFLCLLIRLLSISSGMQSRSRYLDRYRRTRVFEVYFNRNEDSNEDEKGQSTECAL